MIDLDGNSLTLEQLVAIASDFAPVSRSSAMRARACAAARAVVDEFADRDDADLRHQHRLRQLRRGEDPARLAVAAAGQPAAQPRRRRRRAAAGPRRARDDGAARQRAGQGLLRHPARDARPARRAAEPRASTRSCRRAARSGASGDLAPLAHIALVLIGEGEVVGLGGRRRSGDAALARAGLTPAALGPKEGLALINGTQPSTALLGLALAAARAAGARRGHRRGAQHRRAAGVDARRSIARIHAARGFAGQSAVGGQPARAARGQRHQRRARQLRARAGRLFDALRAAGARRGARGLPVRARRVRHRGQCGHRQPDGLRRHARDRLRRQLPRRAGGASPPICCASASRSSPRSASGGRIGWSIRR